MCLILTERDQIVDDQLSLLFITLTLCLHQCIQSLAQYRLDPEYVVFYLLIQVCHEVLYTQFRHVLTIPFSYSNAGHPNSPQSTL